MEDGSYLTHISGWGDDPIDEKIWVFKLAESGRIIWRKTYANWEPGKPNSEFAKDFIADKNSNFFITRLYYKQQPDTDTNYYWVRPMFIKINTAGNELWHLVYGLDDFYIGRSNKSCSDKNGVLYSSGYNSNIDSVGGDSPVIFRVSSDGEMDW